MEQKALMEASAAAASQEFYTTLPLPLHPKDKMTIFRQFFLSPKIAF